MGESDGLPLGYCAHQLITMAVSHVAPDQRAGYVPMDRGEHLFHRQNNLGWLVLAMGRCWRVGKGSAALQAEEEGGGCQSPAVPSGLCRVPQCQAMQPGQAILHPGQLLRRAAWSQYPLVVRLKHNCISHILLKALYLTTVVKPCRALGNVSLPA